MNILKFFKKAKKEDAEKTMLRAPHKLFNGAIVPRRFIAEKLREAGEKAPKVLPNRVRFNSRFHGRQLADGNFIVCRVGKPIPKIGTFLFARNKCYTDSIALAQ